jgi:SAM-dependent methyltransferase
VDSVADLGCGDFNTGRIISGFVARYIGVDIAPAVIDANTRAHATGRISFLQADLTRDLLPPAGAAILRQVLQHLTNKEICAVLNNVLRTYPLTFITEHVYIGRNAIPNLDIPHGPGTRVPMNSGVLVNRPPFSVKAVPLGDIQYARDEVLRTWAVEGTGI